MRSESQKSYDEKHKHPCFDCGKPVCRNATRCISCALKHSWLNAKNRTGVNHRNWKGGRFKTKGGYILTRCPSHPRATQRGYVFEHIVVWEQFHKQSVPEGWLIHHINGVKDDNRIENLVALPKKSHNPHALLKEVQKRVRILEEKLTQLKLL